MSRRLAQHEVHARRAHVDAVEQRRDVAWLGLASALAEAERDRLKTDVVAPLAFLNTTLHVTHGIHPLESGSLAPRRRRAFLELPSHVAGERHAQQRSCPNRRPEHHDNQRSDGRRKLKKVGRPHDDSAPCSALSTRMISTVVSTPPRALRGPTRHRLLELGDARFQHSFSSQSYSVSATSDNARRKSVPPSDAIRLRRSWRLHPLRKSGPLPSSRPIAADDGCARLVPRREAEKCSECRRG